MTVAQIRKLEKIAIEQIGLPSVVLMENAGRAVADSLLKSFSASPRLRVAVLCGTGNNGGDGFVAARHLWARGVMAEVLVCGNISDLKHDPKIFYDALKSLRITVRPIRTINASFVRRISKVDVVIDAIFGIGLNRPLEGFYRQVVQAVNDSRKKIWAVDIPSGLDGSTGKIWGECMKATTTVSFSCMKRGFLINDGPRCTGRVRAVDIGIPDVLFRRLGAACR